jgi:hypothetical protein
MVFNFFLFYLDLLLFYTTHKTLTVIDYVLLYGYLRTNKTFYPSRAPGSIHVTHLFSWQCCVLCYVSDAILHIKPSVECRGSEISHHFSADEYELPTGRIKYTSLANDATAMGTCHEHNADYKSVIRSCK